MNRFPSNRLRVEFDGPDVSQEMLYTLFRVGCSADVHCSRVYSSRYSHMVVSPI